MTIYQGDQYNIPIEIARSGEKQGVENVSKLEVIFAGIRKEYPGEVFEQDGVFYYPLSQEETMSLSENRYNLSVRPMFTDNTVEGWVSAGSIKVRAIKGAEVL